MAYSVNLTQKQEKRLREIIRDYQGSKSVLKRAYCLLLRNEGQSNDNITQLLGVHEDTIADWLRLYKKRGLNGLLTFHYHKRRRSKLNKYRSKIRKIARLKRVDTIEKLQNELYDRFYIEVEYSWLYRYCRKNHIYSTLKGKNEL